MSMVEKFARAICKAEGKNPDKPYKKKPLWTYSVEFAQLIVDELPELTKTAEKKKEAPITTADYEEKLKIGVQKYIDVFNDGTPHHLGYYVKVEKMHPAVLFLHIESLKAAIAGMLK